MHISTPTQIKTLFDTIAPHYDQFNRIASMGMDPFWRKAVLDQVRTGMRVLDIGTGTGDLALGAVRRGAQAVDAVDVSPPMLDIAKKKSHRAGLSNRIRWIAQSASDFNYASGQYDLAVSGFVLRNIRSDLHAILEGVYAALKPGGSIAFVDLTEPDHAWIRHMSGFYMQTIVSLAGLILFKGIEPVRYLRHSMQIFLRANEFAALLGAMGFERVEMRRFMCGMVTCYTAHKKSST